MGGSISGATNYALTISNAQLTNDAATYCGYRYELLRDQ